MEGSRACSGRLQIFNLSYPYIGVLALGVV